MLAAFVRLRNRGDSPACVIREERSGAANWRRFAPDGTRWIAASLRSSQ
jgi:hypothetical protein